MTTLIYIIGCILCFLASRYIIRFICKKNSWNYGWTEVFLVTLMSLISYIGILAIIFIFIIEKDLLKKNKILKKGPPKWM